MRGRTHLIVGAASGIAAAITIPVEDEMIRLGVFTATVVGSLFPDIDNSQSKLGRRVKPISIILNKLFGHRGFIHSPCNLLLIFAAAAIFMAVWNSFIYLPVLIGFSIGFITHIILDAITKGGIPFLYPFSKKRYNFTVIKTGGIGETLFLGAFLLACGAISVIVILLGNVPSMEFLQTINFGVI